MAKVAFLGLGVMGYPMAGHLFKKGGHDVTVYNRTAANIWVLVPTQNGGEFHIRDGSHHAARRQAQHDHVVRRG